VGLPPMAEYLKAFANICHESMEETMRRAMETAKATGGGPPADK
jgi:hemerythrin-like domain-containing protein